MKKKVFQVPCVDVYPVKYNKDAKRSKKFEAISLTNAILKPGTTTKVSITFGDYEAPGVSPDAAWSHIGSMSNSQYPSMNLGFIDPPYEAFEYNGKKYQPDPYATRNYCGTTGISSCTKGWTPGTTVIHEFCHALGMLHEHQNNLFNSNQIKLNVDAVKEYYRRIGMGDDAAYTNVLERYDCTDKDCEYSGTAYDRNSIMLYYLPDDWIEGGKANNPTKPNFIMSQDDISWLKKIYPKDISVSSYPKVQVQFIDKNAPEWKKAWVKKVVTDTFPGMLGVTFDFLEDDVSGSTGSTDVSGSTGSTTPITVSQTATTMTGSDKMIIIGVLSGIVVLTTLIALGVYKKKSIMKLFKKH